MKIKYAVRSMSRPRGAFFRMLNSHRDQRPMIKDQRPTLDVSGRQLDNVGGASGRIDGKVWLVGHSDERGPELGP